MIVNILMLYIACSYSCYAGALLVRWGNLAQNAKIGGVICFAIAPISLPITVGVYFAAKP